VVHGNHAAPSPQELVQDVHHTATTKVLAIAALTKDTAHTHQTAHHNIVGTHNAVVVDDEKTSSL
jgi:hypothetical protein